MSMLKGKVGSTSSSPVQIGGRTLLVGLSFMYFITQSSVTCTPLFSVTRESPFFVCSSWGANGSNGELSYIKCLPLGSVSFTETPLPYRPSHLVGSTDLTSPVPWPLLFPPIYLLRPLDVSRGELTRCLVLSSIFTFLWWTLFPFLVGFVTRPCHRSSVCVGPGADRGSRSNLLEFKYLVTSLQSLPGTEHHP